ncbi:MAG TPA: FHA domain-containing protein [Gemmataceae bacterium]|nr:FHA domain-containing protein [Gemmataceae bacterium]
MTSIATPVRRPILLVQLPASSHLVCVVPANDAVVIGRSKYCDFVIDHPSVSRQHARVTRSGHSAIRVQDLGSRNGTFVDAARVGEAVVPCGRHVRFGDTAVLVCEAGRATGNRDNDLETDCPAAGGRRQTWPTGATALTDAQREVVGLLAQGLPEKAVAKQLGVSVHTAHNHVSAIYRALHVHSRAELMALVLRDQQACVGLAAPPANGGRRPATGDRGTGLRLYYLSPEDRDAYVRILDVHGITHSDSGGFVQIDMPATPEVMRVVSAAVF